MIRTVTGDVDPAALGRVDYHEHLFQVSPLLPGDDLDDEDAGRAEAGLLLNSGFTAMVDATPIGLGRRPAALARIAAATGLHIVATTGVHRDAHYGADHWLTGRSADRLAALFLRDLVDGMPAADAPPAGPAPTGSAGADPTGVRAGLLKAGIDYWSISPTADRVLAAIGQAHAATGAPVMVHLEHGSAAFEVLDRLAGPEVPADAVALAHIDRNPDPGLHAELAAAGAYLGYDGVARHKDWPDSAVLDCLVTAAGLGAADRILLGGDVARRTRYVAYGGLPGLAYLGERFVPRLVRAGGAELADRVLRANPARWLTLRRSG
ncbi:phosphotriesterase family protein [Nakamurella sp.]|uniref:phosphotriesterase family protein n=1 Tax=Nakamurella sp. TaxID=1869182 RepID=UPI003B3AE614